MPGNANVFEWVNDEHTAQGSQQRARAMQWRVCVGRSYSMSCTYTTLDVAASVPLHVVVVNGHMDMGHIQGP